MTDEKKVVIKFLEWYEALTDRERDMFERVLGRMVLDLRRDTE